MNRTQHLKLQRGKSTKAERVFAEILKTLRIPFLAKKKICNREIDFLIGPLAVEINGHDQDPIKNQMLLEGGYIPVHYDNKDVLNYREDITNDIKLKWHEHETQN